MAALGEESVPRQNNLREPLLDDNDRHKINATSTNLLASASLLSLATFSWLNPLLSLGFRKHLVIDDVPPLPPRDQGKNLFSTFNATWETLKTGPSITSQTPSLANSQTPSIASHETPSIAVALVKTFWVSVVGMGALITVNAVAHFVGPYLVDDFVEFLHDGRGKFERDQGWVLVAWFVGANVVANLTQSYYTLAMFEFNVRVRTCLTAIIYRKSLRLSSNSKKRRTIGEIINYMAVDTERVISLSWWVHDLWILPLQITLALAILRRNVGLAPAGAALGATVATLLLNSPLVALEARFQKQLMGAKDARMKTTSECLRNMRILKLQAWETEFLSQIENLRASEYTCLLKRMYTVAASSLLLWISPTLVAITTFGTCIYLNISLTPGRVLSSIATFAILRQPLQFIPELASLLVDARVSLHRLRLFLQEPELPEDAVESGGESGVAVEVENGVFSWNPGEAVIPTLRGVNLRVRSGAHVAVCGQVGSGKSALLACLLGEIPKLEGTVRVDGRTAYVAQTPWIQSGTVKENICFGRSMEEELYEKVLQACDLKRDIALFPFGDETSIGERGINLSGGQKQRVQLARALYQEADVYFLDDPFSAVDAHTGSHLLKECIMGFLASKTVVYVTHQMESLYSADHILVLRDGVIIQAGKYDDLLQMGTQFSTLVTAHNKALEDMQMHANTSNGELDSYFERSASNGGSHELDTHFRRSASNGGSHLSDEEVTSDFLKDEEVALLTSEAQQLIKDEERETGSVPYHVYWAYATAVAGGAFIPVYVFSQVAFQVIQILSSYWMAWGTSSAAHVSSNKLISVYSLLGAFGAAFVLLKTITVSITGLKAGQKYFTKMLRSVFRAPASFFDSTPSGRIISRMSADQEIMDMQMPFTLNNFVNDLIVVAGILALMSQITSHILLLVLPIAVACILYQRYNIASGRELARMGRHLKAPIISHYGESIAGATTIRGFRQEERFMDLNLDHLDRYGTIFFHRGAVREWLTMRLEMLSTIGYAFFLIFLITLPQGYISPSLAGVAITYAINFGVALESLVLDVGQLETTVIAVERILQYCTLPSEPPLIIENARPAQNWPSQGTIQICNLQIRYNAHSPLVLHGLSCTFNGGEKVGIVGRTGSGKSTLIQALFRVVEPAGGRIEIDKLDISTIGLHDLRSKLSIIPQDPTLFEGSMRINLDPLGKYSDAEIWEALDKCQLGDIIRATENKLETSVSENGENWSVGQRQLVCLGRALLKQTRILVLDEATASVDSATDALIQETLRKEFSACTVITIAHRIPTIVDSDKVLVLDNGRVVEHDSPTALLQVQSSFFSKLVMEYSTRFTENDKF